MQVTDAPLPRLEGRCRSRQVLGECRNSLGLHAAAFADQPSSHTEPVGHGPTLDTRPGPPGAFVVARDCSVCLCTVHAIGEVDVGMAWWPEHGGVARGQPPIRMRAGVLPDAPICLDLSEPRDHAQAIDVRDEASSQQLRCHHLGPFEQHLNGHAASVHPVHDTG